MTAKTLFTGNTNTRLGSHGRSADGFVDLKLDQPHPAAENLFGIAWSACFTGALQLAAQQRRITLPAETEIDAEIKLNHGGGADFFLSAKLDVSLPGIDRETARALVDQAHEICPYSKATRGNIDVEVNLI